MVDTSTLEIASEDKIKVHNHSKFTRNIELIEPPLICSYLLYLMLQLNLTKYSWNNVHELSYNVKVAASPSGTQSFWKPLTGHLTYMGL